jgi:hypothetical protein
MFAALFFCQPQQAQSFGGAQAQHVAIYTVFMLQRPYGGTGFFGQTAMDCAVIELLGFQGVL